MRQSGSLLMDGCQKFGSVTVLRLLLSEFQPDVDKLLSLHLTVEDNELCYHGY